MVNAVGMFRRARIDKVAQSQNVDGRKGRYAVGVHEPAVEHGDGHPAATESRVVESVAAAVSYVLLGIAVALRAQRVPAPERVVYLRVANV